MRMHRSPRRAAQPRLKPDIEPVDDRVDPLAAGRQTLENPGLALAAMGDEGADMRLGIGDRRAVGRPVDAVVAWSSNLSSARQIGGHVAVGRRNNAGRPAHHMVAREQQPFLFQGEAEMVGGVAGRVHASMRQPSPWTDVAVAQARCRA